MSRSPIGISNVSPIATVLAVVRLSENRNVPPAGPTVSQADQCEIVSAADIEVQVTAAEFVIAPPDAAQNVGAIRVVWAATFAVPAEPGSPMCSLRKNPTGSEYATERQRASRIAFACPTAIPVATSDHPELEDENQDDHA